MAFSLPDDDRLAPTERTPRADPDPFLLTDAQAEELDRRVLAYEEDRDAGQPWREVLESIRSRSD